MAATVAGSNDWLFLGDDSNASVRQFCGEIKLTPQVADAWGGYFKWLNDQARERNFSYSFLIAPSKESVYHQYYPYSKSDRRPVDDFLSRFPAALYPVENLSIETPHHTYSRTDTHWSDFGAFVALKHQLQTMSIDLDDARFEFELVDIVGDLGNKVTPNVSSSSAMLKGAAYSNHRIVNNEIHNHGRIWIFENKDAPIKRNCVLFGDSFALNFTKILSRVFSRLAYVHTTTPTPEILDVENPSIVICQVAERFLPRAPESVDKFSLRNLIAQKILQLSPEDQLRCMAAQPNFLKLDMSVE